VLSLSPGLVECRFILFIVWRVFSRSALLTNIEGLKQWFRLSVKIHSSIQCDNGMDQLLFPPLIIFVVEWAKKTRKTNWLLSVFEWWLSLWGQKISINLFSLIDDDFILSLFILHSTLFDFFLFYSEIEWIILDHFLSWGGRGQKISINLFSLIDGFILSLSIQPCSIFLFYSEMEWIILDHFLSWEGGSKKSRLTSLVDDDFILSLFIFHFPFNFVRFPIPSLLSEIEWIILDHFLSFILHLIAHSSILHPVNCLITFDTTISRNYITPFLYSVILSTLSLSCPFI